MNPVRTASMDGDLGPPPGVSDEDCGHLPYRSGQAPGGGHVFASVWQPTAEEREMLAEGGNVQLEVWGDGHPPVSVQVTDEGVST